MVDTYLRYIIAYELITFLYHECGYWCATRPFLSREGAHPARLSQRNSLVVLQLRWQRLPRKGAYNKFKSLPSGKHPWTTATLKSRLFAITRPPHVSLLFNLILTRRHFQAAYFSLRLVPSPAVSVDCLIYRPSPAMKRKKCSLARVEWLPVTFRSHGRTNVRLV